MWGQPPSAVQLSQRLDNFAVTEPEFGSPEQSMAAVPHTIGTDPKPPLFLFSQPAIQRVARRRIRRQRPTPGRIRALEVLAPDWRLSLRSVKCSR